MNDYLFHHNANTHWAYPTSEETDAALEQARQACADLVNASFGEIAFGANMTTLTFHLARALGLQHDGSLEDAAGGTRNNPFRPLLIPGRPVASLSRAKTDDPAPGGG